MTKAAGINIGVVNKMVRKGKLEKLLEPFQIRQVKLKNRMVKAPYSSVTADRDGYVTDEGLSFYEAVARGGIGLSIVEATAIDPLGVSGSPRLVIFDDKFIPGLRKLAGTIHKYDCPVFLQLHHAGPAHSTGVYGGQVAQRVSAAEPVAASALTRDELPAPVQNLPKALTIPEVEDLVRKFIKGAERAQEAGFDGVELHFAHTYLVNSFLSRAWNKRRDAYGGDLGNRVRFAVEITRGVRQHVGEGFVLGARINGAEYGTEKGLTTAEAQEIARMLREAGIDYFSVTGWGYGPYEWLLFPERILYPEPAETVAPLAKKVKKGAFVDSTEAIRRATSTPVIAVGRLDPELGEWILKKGKADLIAFCRRLIADPELPNKIASGRLEDIAPCTACMGCFDNFIKGEPERCRVNPAFGRELEYAIKPAAKKKKVMIVGGGPAGMEAARVAALRGHEVTLYEREHKLGGLLPIAALVKGVEIEDLPALVRYLRTQITKLGVKVELGKEVDLALVEKIKPDVVVVATGGTLTTLEIPGINKSNVVRSSDLHPRVEIFLRFLSPRLLRWLTRFWMPVGKRVVIVGGLIQGCEVAEFLVKRGRDVTIAETSNQLGIGIPDVNRVRLLRWLAEKGVTMLSEVRYEEITDKGLTLITKEGERHTIAADTILIATPPKPNTELLKILEGKVPEIYLIGDCKEPKLIVDAIDDGSRIGRTV